MDERLASVFKAYDIRGVYPSEINEELFEKIGRAYVALFRPQKLAIGRDVRTSSPKLFRALVRGVASAGADVVDIGTITTDMLYFAVGYYGYDGGMTVTASHNPKEYNGLKMVKRGPGAISAETGIFQIRDLILSQKELPKSHVAGSVDKKEILSDYVSDILQFVDTVRIKPFRIAVNPNFGAVIPVLDALAKQLPLRYVKFNYKIDGSFPKGKPDPLILENRKEFSRFVAEKGVDFGVAWDADADRCFFFDENGEFVDPYYLVGFLAKIILRKYPGSKVLYDPRLVWASEEQIKEAGGIPVVWRAGHSFIKQKMRQDDIVFAGETSGHYYFKDYYFSDNGMIPFLMILSELSEKNLKLSEIFSDLRKKYPNSGEINFVISDLARKMEEIKKIYHDGKLSEIDGLSIEYPNWRFNLRASNTEPLLRLNVEAKDKNTLKKETEKLIKLIKAK